MAWGAPRGISDLVERVRKNDASLTALCLMRGRRLDDEGCADLSDALAGNTVLRELTIASHAVSPAAAAAFARALAVNRGLAILDLGNSGFGDEGLAALAPGVAGSASLRRLVLEGKGLSAAGCAALAAALAGGSGETTGGQDGSSSGGGGGLEELLLGRNSIGSEGLAALLGSGCTLGGSLRQLDLTDCGLEGAAGVQPLAAALAEGRLPALRSLRLDGNQLGGEGMAALADALRAGRPGLQQLHLQRCGLAAGGVAALAAAIPSAGLAVLDLSGNQLGSGGAAALAQALSAGAARQLRKLLLCGCSLDDSAVAALAAALAEAAAAEPAAAVPAGAAAASEPAAALDLDLSGNAAGAAAVAALAAAPLSALCLHDCKLGAGSGGSSGADELAERLAAPGSFPALLELDVSANRLEAAQLLALLAALAQPAAGAAGAACPSLRLLVIAANPGAAEEAASDAVERLQEGRPGLDVVRRAADTGEGGLSR